MGEANSPSFFIERGILMSIVIKSKKIKEDIVNENGDIIATISFNPEDSKSYTKLSDITKKRFGIG